MLFKKKNKIEIVPESDYTDFSDRETNNVYATKKTVIAAAAIPAIASAGLIIHRLTVIPDIHTATSIPVSAPVNVLTDPSIIPTNMTAITTPLPSNTGVIADASLDMLANILDPLIQIMVAISFPIASVIMIGACFMFMFDNSEKAWNMIMKAGLGYVLIQMSPLFLEILRQVGKAV